MTRLFSELDFPFLISFTAGYKQFAVDEIADPQTRCKHQNAETNRSTVDLAFHRCTPFYTLALTTSQDAGIPLTVSCSNPNPGGIGGLHQHFIKCPPYLLDIANHLGFVLGELGFRSWMVDAHAALVVVPQGLLVRQPPRDRLESADGKNERRINLRFTDEVVHQIL